MWESMAGSEESVQFAFGDTAGLANFQVLVLARHDGDTMKAQLEMQFVTSECATQ